MSILHVFERIQEVCPLERDKCGITLEHGTDFVLFGDWENKLQEGDKVLIDLEDWSEHEKSTVYVFRNSTLIQTINLDSTSEFNQPY